MSVELIFPDEFREGFQIEAGLRIQDGVRRMLPKRSFRLFFRKEFVQLDSIIRFAYPIRAITISTRQITEIVAG